MIYSEPTVSSEKIFTGRVINLRVDTVELPDGKKSTREVIEHPGGVGIIPITANKEVVMVRQFRKPIEDICLEIPAGKLNYGEDPYECGVRELEEETGYKSRKVEFLCDFFSTPGFTDEVLHLYMATDLYDGELNPDEDEFVETELIPLEKLVEMVMNNEVKDGKSIVAILMAAKLLLNNNY